MAITIVVLAIVLVVLLFLGDEDNWGGGKGEPALVRVPVKSENRLPPTATRRRFYLRG
ncbi:MAG: hypothetical protein NZ901_06725 [Geminocystis sp.]|nr:hypothetical protein [Geminocystis sp.]HIK38782.1 hypothetical protein [Geminocystis sp. M7585_C2015_104]MCS7147869.1 hypothetical protein [Geminocystis sp.]MCX8078695.1 hypothetical protein [Geminocystis sp.]MDW8117043.1 hypothetical protein [Geminocystis sp.]